jgi:branched-chain amino acid transport system ATP-binding protein
MADPSMSVPILHAQGLTRRFGALLATDGVDLSLEEGELHAIIGPNGAGKTTLIGQLAGELRADAGRILFAASDITRLSVPKRAALGLGRSYQISSVFADFTVLENLAFAVQAKAGHSFRFWRDVRSDGALLQPARAVLESLGLAARAELRVANLSHGERRQLEIGMTLAMGARVLLLDEPTAGMGIEESARMVEMIRGLKRRLTILLVEHDMNAVFSLADRITVLDYGKVIASDTPDVVRANAEVKRAYFG